MKNQTILCLAIILLLATQASSVAKISSALQERISTDSEDKIRVIVLTEQAPTRQLANYAADNAARSYSVIPAYYASLTGDEIRELSRNSHVKQVFLDRLVKRVESEDGGVGLNLQTSVESVGARYVREQLNITGRNVTVAVIDTGIDYRHPDLGGCFGPSCRVVGGFDFVYNDTDPVDDHSHGTHVAGIIGANGSLTGVAPDAKFYALKVCDAGGWCWDSDIIAAVDWALVNNADIISMSLGGIYQPNDEEGVLEHSLAEAVSRGVFVSVSAGNSGPGTQTIEHPASSSNVVTVGSSNDRATTRTSDDVLSDFSSRGPSAWGRLDPDIVAPGTDIYSTVLGSVYGTKQGTSMAAPHVAGAAALILEANPGLSPAIVRRMLMNSAENITGNIFGKGAGQLNVSRAIQSSVSATSSGVERVERHVLPGENTSITVNYSNTGNETRNLSLTLEQLKDSKEYLTLEPGIFVFPMQVSVSASNSSVISVNVTMPSNASPGVYGGTLVAASDDNQAIRLPIVVSIPKIGDGSVYGKITTGGADEGDWIYIPLKPANSRQVTITLSGGTENVDLYLYAPNGELVNYSDSSNPESLSAYNLSYDTYWAVAHGRSVATTVIFNMTFSYPSNFTVSPGAWAGAYGGDVTEIIFTLVNDNESKQNMSLSVVSSVERERLNHTMSSSVPRRVEIPGDSKNFTYTDLSCARVWFRKDLNQSLEDIWYVDVNASWTPNHNLDLYLAYWDDDGDQVLEAGEHNATRYSATSENKISGVNAEYIERADILYYSMYSDVGVAVCNPENTTDYNGTINISITTYDRQAYGRAMVNPSLINLSAFESKNVTVTFNITNISRGVRQNLTFLAGEYAQIPIVFESGNPKTPSVTLLPTYSAESTITINWTPSSSAINISHYVIEHSNDSDFNSKTTVNSTQNTTNLTLADGTHYIRVKAVDAEGYESQWSNTANTTIDTTPPSAPILQFNPAAEGNHTPTLNWTGAQDEVSGVAYYLLQLSFTDSFANASLIVNTTNTSTHLSLSDGIHYARARAYDTAGNTGNFSATANKTVKTVFLNEVNPSEPWIELYTTRTEETSLTGWTFTSNQGTMNLTQEIPAQWMLLINSTQLTITLNQSNDTIILANPQAQLIDNLSFQNTANQTSLGRTINGAGTWTTFNSSTMTPGISNYQTQTYELSLGFNLISLPVAPEW